MVLAEILGRGVYYIPMDALQISGKWYISSRRAAKEHGYHADYIGQLVRGGKVKGQKVGRSWYVLADSLTDYLEKETAAATKKEKTGAKKTVPVPISPSKKTVQHRAVEVEETEEGRAKNGERAESVKDESVSHNVVQTHASHVVDAKKENERKHDEEDVEQVEDVPVKPQAPAVRREYPLLTYLHDEESLIPAVPPAPVVPQTNEADSLRVSEETHIPIHAAVKRWGAVTKAPVSASIQGLPAVRKLPTRPIPVPMRKRGLSRWLILAMVGAGVFIATTLLSALVSTTVSI